MRGVRVNLSDWPDPPKEYVVEFPRLDGGLNTWELDYRLDANESPDIVNLWWQDGALCCRDGQTRLTAQPDEGTGWSAYETLFWGHGFFHIGDGLYHAQLDNPDAATGSVAFTQLLDGVPENRGSWFRYGDCLYYKNRGGYYCIQYDAETESFSAAGVVPYEPIILINTEPSTSAGDEYQPENRISPVKTVWYSEVEGVTTYCLPVEDVDSVDKVVVDEVELAEGEGYTVDLTAGIVTFATAPTHHNPYVANTVKITYSKANADAEASIMDCPYAVVYGGDQNLCVVLGGCPAQPNAYFWCGNHIVMDPGYFPMEQYNFAGATEEYITGFGKQQAMLVIFKEHSVGRTTMGTQEMASGRVLITMDYTNINSRVGCDLPWTIQLVENNLVFCNTERGVHMVRDSTSALENNITPISRKVDNGLLPLLRRAEHTASFDDGSRYWVAAEGEVYAWDYTLSGYSDPSWFYFDNIHGAAFLHTDAAENYHLGPDGSLTVFRRTFADYGQPIRKVYRFATQYMGGYDRLKDVTSVLFAVRGDTDTDIDILYTTDYEERYDLTPIRSYSWRLSPRNLAYRFLGVRRFATVVRRRPGCRHIRHFAVTLSNETLGTDMSVVSAQVFYKYQGRER